MNKTQMYVIDRFIWLLCGCGYAASLMMASMEHSSLIGDFLLVAFPLLIVVYYLIGLLPVIKSHLPGFFRNHLALFKHMNSKTRGWVAVVLGLWLLVVAAPIYWGIQNNASGTAITVYIAVLAVLAVVFMYWISLLHPRIQKVEQKWLSEHKKSGPDFDGKALDSTDEPNKSLKRDLDKLRLV